VHVSAKDLGTGKEQKIRIESSSGLSESEIEKMVKEAELHAEEDRKEKERVETINEADTLIYSTEKSLKDFGDKLPEDEKRKIEAAIEDLKKAMESGIIDRYQAKSEALAQASHKLAEEMYQKCRGSGSRPPDPAVPSDAGAGVPGKCSGFRRTEKRAA